MKSYLISFNLQNPAAHLQNVSTLLRTFPKWACIKEDLWIVRSKDNIEDTRQKIVTAMEGQGFVMVINISDDAWGTYAVDREITDWMKENI